LIDPLRLKQKNRQQGGGFVKAVLLVSAPPDRLRRGIKAAKKEHFGTNHAWESTKTGRITPSAFDSAGFTSDIDTAAASLYAGANKGEQCGNDG
jgi:hypothetical protein